MARHALPPKPVSQIPSDLRPELIVIPDSPGLQTTHCQWLSEQQRLVKVADAGTTAAGVSASPCNVTTISMATDIAVDRGGTGEERVILGRHATMSYPLPSRPATYMPMTYSPAASEAPQPFVFAGQAPPGVPVAFLPLPPPPPPPPVASYRVPVPATPLKPPASSEQAPQWIGYNLQGQHNPYRPGGGQRKSLKRHQERKEHQERVQMRMEKRSKREKDTSETECQWRMYGCKYVVNVSDCTAHEDICPYRCDPTVTKLWKEVIAYQESYPDMRPDIWGLLATKACSFRNVERHDKTSNVTMDVPLLFESSDIWDNGEPDVDEAGLACFQAPRLPGTTLEPEDADYYTIIYQLHGKKHSPAEVQYAIDMYPGDLCHEYPMSLPVSLEKGHRIGCIGYNATPLHSWVDLHVDRGQDNIASSIGAEKFWFLWPPTPENEKQFYDKAFLHKKMEENSHRSGSGDSRRVRSLGSKLVMIAPFLTGGRIVKTCPKSTLFIPAGWIHGVLTTTGGLLAGYTWSSTDRIETLLRCLKHEIRGGNELKDLEGSVVLILDLLDHKMMEETDSELFVAIKQWIELIAILEDHAWNSDWGVQIEEKTVLSTENLSRRGKKVLPRSCPCSTKNIKFDMAIHIKTHTYEIKVAKERRGPQTAKRGGRGKAPVRGGRKTLTGGTENTPKKKLRRVIHIESEDEDLDMVEEGSRERSASTGRDSEEDKEPVGIKRKVISEDSDYEVPKRTTRSKAAGKRGGGGRGGRGKRAAK